MSRPLPTFTWCDSSSSCKLSRAPAKVSGGMSRHLVEERIINDASTEHSNRWFHRIDDACCRGGGTRDYTQTGRTHCDALIWCSATQGDRAGRIPPLYGWCRRWAGRRPTVSRFRSGDTTVGAKGDTEHFIHVVCHALYMLRAKFGCNGKIVGGGILHIAHVLFKMLSNGVLLFF